MKVELADNYPAVGESGGGKDQISPVEFLNECGREYSNLSTLERKKVFTQCFSFLSGLGSDRVIEKTIGQITEPWLARDLVINAPNPMLWWPHDEVVGAGEFLRTHRTWQECQKGFGGQNLFLVAFNVIKPGRASKEVEEIFFRQHLELVDRTLDVAAAFIQISINRKAAREDIDQTGFLEEGLNLYREDLRPVIREKMRQKGRIQL